MTAAQKKREGAAIELSSIEFLPREEALRRSDDLLRNMLNSPPDPHTPKPKKKPIKRAK